MSITTHDNPGILLAAPLVGVAVVSALLAGMVSIQFSIATVFLFAGPHNWFEARYIIGRLPARAGKLWPFFLLSLIGIIGLTSTFLLLPFFGRNLGESPANYELLTAGWNSAFVLWIATLVHMRSRTIPRRDWGWVWTVAFLLIAFIWMTPFFFAIGLVYLHPLMALWILDRELLKSRPEWRSDYHKCLMVIPVLSVFLFVLLKNASPLPGTDPLSLAITNHAGDWLLTGVSNHFLVALHTFLEMVHYSVWVLIIPLIGLRSKPWELRTIPAAQRSLWWRNGVACFLLAGILVVVVLWTCFLVDYGTTRSIYFGVAMLHVLTEIPFLLRVL